MEDPGRLGQRAESLVNDHEEMLHRLVALRGRYGLSQSEVAERMGVSQPTVSAFEHYDSNPTLSTIRRYAMAVGARIVTEVLDDTEDSDQSVLMGPAKSFIQQTRRPTMRWGDISVTTVPKETYA